MSRREYKVNLVVNHRKILKVIIDPHFEEKHGESITDEIIIGLVKTLDGEVVIPDQVSPPYSYFTTDRIEFKGKFY